MRTNIIIDDEMMKTAMEISGIPTKNGVVDVALKEFVAHRTRKNLRDLRGKINFVDGYDYTALRKGM